MRRWLALGASRVLLCVTLVAFLSVDRGEALSAPPATPGEPPALPDLPPDVERARSRPGGEAAGAL